MLDRHIFEIYKDRVEDISPEEIWALLEAYQCPCDPHQQ